MRIHLRNTLLAGAAVFLIAAALSAQTPATPPPPPAASYRFDVAVLYGATSSDVVGGSSFWMQGGGVEAHGFIYRGLGIAANFSGAHQGSIQSSAVGLDLISATFGPRYTWQPSRRYALYGQGLVGVAHASNSEFPATSGTASSATSLAVNLGGGFNIAFTPHIALRAIEASWLRTQFANSSTATQGSCQLNSGLVFRF